MIYYFKIYRGVGDPVYIREVVYGLNAKEKKFLSMLMTNLQLNCATGYETKIEMRTSTQN